MKRKNIERLVEAYKSSGFSIQKVGDDEGVFCPSGAVYSRDVLMSACPLCSQDGEDGEDVEMDHDLHDADLLKEAMRARRFYNLSPPKEVGKKTYFVFQYYHDKKHSALIPFVSDMKTIQELDGFSNVDPEERNEDFWNKKCLDALVATGTKEVFSIRCRNAMRDNFLGFLLHYSEGEGGDFFHYDFVDPQTEGEKFRRVGIELKEFKRK